MWVNRGRCLVVALRHRFRWDEEHMEKRVKVALGLGTVVALCWPDHKEPIHGCSVGHVDMPVAIKQTLTLQKKREKKITVQHECTCE